MEPFKTVAGLAPTRKVFSFVEEFKNFAFKGNVIDLAVGVIIGAAFGKIISSLVEHIIMPLVSLALPVDQGYKDWAWEVNGKKVLYGQFLSEVVNFLIVALVLFIFFKIFLGWVMRTREEQAAAPPLTRDQQLLTEIRDVLKNERAAPSPGAPLQG
jgi:large conductance mechanosensitive channel